MKGSYVGKPAGAKLLRLDLEWDGALVVRASIRGDFFAHPEDGFDEAEAALAGVPVAELGAALSRELVSRGVTLFGLSPGDVAAAAAVIVASVHGDRA
jgi:hypothetical protein